MLTACWPASRVPCKLTLLVVAPAEIIGAGMHDDHALDVKMSALTSWFIPTEDDISWRQGTPDKHQDGSHTPKTLSGPINLISGSVTVALAFPCASVEKFPKSPT